MNETGLTLDDIIKNYLVLISYEGDAEPNKNTVIDAELVKNVCSTLKIGITNANNIIAFPRWSLSTIPESIAIPTIAKLLL